MRGVGSLSYSNHDCTDSRKKMRGMIYGLGKESGKILWEYEIVYEAWNLKEQIILNKICIRNTNGQDKR